MLKGTQELLQALMEKYPPPANGGRHGFTLDDNGRLTLTLVIDGMFYPFIISDEADLEMPVAEHLQEIAEVMKPVLEQGPESWPGGKADDADAEQIGEIPETMRLQQELRSKKGDGSDG